MYNAERYLDECIQSVLDQTYPHTEIIAVDDGSTDTSAEILDGYADRIRVYRKENGGTASALNLGARRMSGDWFKWLSADDALKPHAVATLAGAARSLGWPDDHIFYARCDYINEHGKRAGRLAAIEPNYNRRSDFERNAILLRRFYANGITSMFHRSVFGRCGPFDETLGYSEDYEFWLRCCLLHGCRLRLVPRSIARYRVHTSTLTSAHAGESKNKDDQIRAAVLSRLPAGLRSKYIEAAARVAPPRPPLVPDQGGGPQGPVRVRARRGGEGRRAGVPPDQARRVVGGAVRAFWPCAKDAEFLRSCLLDAHAPRQILAFTAAIL